MGARNLLDPGYPMHMKAGVVPSSAQAAGDARSVWPLAVALLFFTILWLEIVRHLRGEWSFNPQYSYGWSVPLLALYLFWRRWPGRPEPVAPKSRWLPILFLALGALLFVPLRFVAEANPDWRLLSWALGLSAVAMSLCFLYLSAGKAWARHFIFPFVFFLVAVPWPTQVEQAVTQNLMAAVTTINVLFLNIAGVPALQQGNVIEVGSGLIGIEEACSGVRSFQATLMISLFLGELYSFTVGRRILLVVAGALLAFVCNLVRTAILVWVGAHQGANAIHAWHDPAGFSILLVCLLGLWAISLFLRRHTPADVAPPSLESKRATPRFPFLLTGSLVAWLILGELAVQFWYNSHQSPLAQSRWGVHWPSDHNAYEKVTVAPEAQGLLRYDEGGGAAWNGPDGRPWMMYYFRWLPGRTAALFVKTHRPDICLPASGMKMVSDAGVRQIKVNGVNLPVRSYRFERNSKPLHVFYCYWDARSSYEDTKGAAEEDWTPRGRLRAALRGRRELGAQMLEVIVWGYDQDGEADEALQRQLAQVIRPG